MKKVLLFFFVFFLFIITWYGESRKFYCLENGKYITVWKTYNDICYIVTGKYYGITKPTNNSIETSNLNEGIVIFFTDELPNTLIVQSEEKYRVINKGGFVFLNYNFDSTRLHSILYKSNAKLYYKDLKDKSTLIDINVKENYAKGRGGKVYN